MNTKMLLCFIVLCVQARISVSQQRHISDLYPEYQLASMNAAVQEDKPASANPQSDSPANAALLAQGRLAFESSCTQCHEAARALDESKDYAGWLETIEEMAAKKDAKVRQADFHAIALYLAARSTKTRDSEATASEDKDAGKEDKQGDSAQKNKPDDASIAAGRTAFEKSCLKCHDAERSLSKSKSYSDWMSTVRRMAAKDGADIRESEFSSIATYLASLSETSGASGESGETASADSGGWSFGTTISTIHRSASDEALVENPGFFADAWVTASYQSSGAWGATVTACTSCHSTNSSINFYSLEVLEGSATVDVRKLFSSCKDDSGVQLLLKSGRFPVPFGAFSAMSHPGVYRTVTAPLMFNMGRRVFASGAAPPRQPVLPLPFADEGIDFMLKAPLTDNINFGLDVYAVNGLQGSEGNIFRNSRAYSDNNEEPSFGLRTSLGGEFLKLGASLLHGGLQDQGQPLVDYTLWGADATAQLTDRLRLYGEFARRRQDSSVAPGTAERIFGVIGEAEYKLLKERNVSMVVRYDTLEHRSFGFGDDSIERLTSGFNIGLPGGSLLMINHEHWQPEIGDDVDLVGVRWSVSL